MSIAQEFVATTKHAKPTKKWIGWYPTLAAKWAHMEVVSVYAAGRSDEVVCQAADGSTMAFRVEHLIAADAA